MRKWRFKREDSQERKAGKRRRAKVLVTAVCMAGLLFAGGAGKGPFAGGENRIGAAVRAESVTETIDGKTYRKITGLTATTSYDFTDMIIGDSVPTHSDAGFTISDGITGNVQVTTSISRTLSTTKTIRDVTTGVTKLTWYQVQPDGQKVLYTGDTFEEGQYLCVATVYSGVYDASDKQTIQFLPGRFPDDKSCTLTVDGKIWTQSSDNVVQSNTSKTTYNPTESYTTFTSPVYTAKAPVSLGSGDYWRGMDNDGLSRAAYDGQTVKACEIDGYIKAYAEVDETKTYYQYYYHSNSRGSGWRTYEDSTFQTGYKMRCCITLKPMEKQYRIKEGYTVEITTGYGYLMEWEQDANDPTVFYSPAFVVSTYTNAWDAVEDVDTNHDNEKYVVSNAAIKDGTLRSILYRKNCISGTTTQKIYESAAEKIRYMEIAESSSYAGLSSLEGLEYFPYVRSLHIKLLDGNTTLTKIDLSRHLWLNTVTLENYSGNADSIQLPAGVQSLEIVNCPNLTDIDSLLKKLPELRSVKCSGSGLTSLDLPDN